MSAAGPGRSRSRRCSIRSRWPRSARRSTTAARPAAPAARADRAARRADRVAPRAARAAAPAAAAAAVVAAAAAAVAVAVASVPEPGELGVGVGMRPEHYAEFLRGDVAPARWVEVNAEKYLPDRDGARGARGAHLQVLEHVRAGMPVVLHGTSMSLGSACDDRGAYLARLVELCAIIEPAMVSDHLCWTGIDDVHLYDLLPLPFSAESIDVLVERIS